MNTVDMNTIERAHGRWPEILTRLGIERRFLVNRHGPCPLCGGKDRFRFDDKEGTGSYYCNGCGAGVGIIMLRKFHKWDHATACREVDEIIGNEPIAPPSTPPPKDSPADRCAKIERVIAEATDIAIVPAYITARGLSVVPDVLRGHRALGYYDDDGRFVGRFPAMIAPVMGPDGALQSVHRTYLTDHLPKRKRKKFMRAIDTIRGGAVRLFAVVDEMGIAEGIETAIACTELFEMPTWAAVSTSGIESFEPPTEIKRLHIFGDNDLNFAGQKAAYVLANRLALDLALDLALEVSIPPEPDTDWLDVLNEGSGP